VCVVETRLLESLKRVVGDKQLCARACALGELRSLLIVYSKE
jgi:hypothetical protein